MVQRAPRNRTINLSDTDYLHYEERLLRLSRPVLLDKIINRTICQDVFEILDWMPANSIDLIFADPPYNLTKSFNDLAFQKIPLNEYEKWLNLWIPKLLRLLKPTSSIYICGDWRSSAAIHTVLEKYFIVRNRITWEREKGRGAKKNWKNCSEDIWFGTVSDDYRFNLESVKLNRKVLAPYTHNNGKPKDWEETDNGRFRITHPSNIWTDLTVPFWSMPENTDHPTQKPEKLLAKIILASSQEGDIIFDPFLGAGTTSVVAKKLNRQYIGIEIDETYCCLAEKRLEMADANDSIQGYSDSVFWERNTSAGQKLKHRSLHLF
ncbi:MAG: DNA methyltransferase [Candidatus Hatepunaea meridiana]|nr:DNA methyltransferase [Candidatus Hatepunaea meridiana]